MYRVFGGGAFVSSRIFVMVQAFVSHGVVSTALGNFQRSIRNNEEARKRLHYVVHAALPLKDLGV